MKRREYNSSLNIRRMATGNTDDFAICQYEGEETADMPSGKMKSGHILLCIKGTASIEHNHKPFDIAMRDIVQIFPNDIFRIDGASSDFSVYLLSYSSEIFDEVMYNFPSTFIGHIEQQPVYSLSEDEFYIFGSEHFRILAVKINDVDNICRYEIVINLLRNLFMEIYDKIVRNCRIDTAQTNRKRSLFDKFVNMQSAHPDRREVAYFAEAMCITPKYLSSIINSVTGMTAKEFIHKSIIAELKQTLRSTDASVKEIAEQFDFPSGSNMCRYFKAHTGMTISTYRESVRSM